MTDACPYVMPLHGDEQVVSGAKAHQTYPMINSIYTTAVPIACALCEQAIMIVYALMGDGITK